VTGNNFILCKALLCHHLCHHLAVHHNTTLALIILHYTDYSNYYYRDGIVGFDESCFVLVFVILIKFFNPAFVNSLNWKDSQCGKTQRDPNSSLSTCFVFASEQICEKCCIRVNY